MPRGTAFSFDNYRHNLLKGRNCSGTRGKRSLDQGKLDIIKKYVFKLYPCGQALEDAQWRRCVIAIDEVLRRGKKGARQQ